MFKYFSKRFFHSLRESSKSLNIEAKGKINKISKFKQNISNIFIRYKMKLNYRITLRNLLPNRYPLTSFLLILNIWK